MRLDPQFEPLRRMPAPPINAFTLRVVMPLMRVAMAARQKLQRRRASSLVSIEDRSIAVGNHRVPIRIYRPKSAGLKGALLYLHGGGWIMGNLDSEHGRCVDYAERADCVVISVDYRLAPAFPFPAAHEDAWAALLWLIAHASELSLDPIRVAVGGGSAGATLAAGIALRARDEGGPGICLAMLVQPVVDHRSTFPSARTFTDTPVLNATQLGPIWRAYLGPTPPTGKALSYAAPLAAQTFAGFPPTLMMVGEVDPSRDEALAFGAALTQAGTEVDLHLLPGAPHGFDLVEDAPATRLALDLRIAALIKALGPRPGR